MDNLIHKYLGLYIISTMSLSYDENPDHHKIKNDFMVKTMLEKCHQEVHVAAITSDTSHPGLYTCL